MEYEKCECNWYMGGLVKAPSLWVTYHYGRLPYSAGASSLIRFKGCQAMEYEKCECNWYMGGLVKDHHYGLPITMVDFHTQQGLVVSSDAKAVKLWNMRNVSVRSTWVG